jgi:hypothetical protein
MSLAAQAPWGKMPAVQMLLVRHASAGQRQDWRGDDLDRPLDAVGAQQAALVARRLAPLAPARLLSSPARRCQQTMAPLAGATGVAVELVPWLAVDSQQAAASALTELMLAVDGRRLDEPGRLETEGPEAGECQGGGLECDRTDARRTAPSGTAARPLVLCTHGEVLAAVLPAVVAPALWYQAQADGAPPPPGAKAGTWVLDWHQGTVVGVRYWPPPTGPAC